TLFRSHPNYNSFLISNSLVLAYCAGIKEVNLDETIFVFVPKLHQLTTPVQDALPHHADSWLWHHLPAPWRPCIATAAISQLSVYFVTRGSQPASAPVDDQIGQIAAAALELPRLRCPGLPLAPGWVPWHAQHLP